MNLTIGTVLDDSRTINKTFTPLSDPLTCKIKNDTDIINPVFVINSPGTLTFNYCYCDTFARYYYVNNIEVMNGGLIALNCTVDPLKSFAEGIGELDVIIDKQEAAAKSNLYMNDGSFVTEVRTTNEVLVFDDGFSDTGEYILISAGGGV